MTISLPVLFEDECLIAVDKPAGMFVHRSEADRNDTDVVVQRVREHTGHFVYPAHRLDRATSGIVLLAKSPDTAALVGALFAERRVRKVYRALIRGHCETSGRIDTALIAARGRDKPPGHPYREPQDAITEFQRLQTFEIPFCSDRYPTTRCSLVDVQPLTGRYHQIRRHFNYESHPVIGDTSHGDNRQNQFYRSRFGLNRLMLAAVRLEFEHPMTQRSVVVECEPAAEFQVLMEQLQPFQLR
ncbi:pseudouridine synthase [Fuerstiella marisgermanici]|uniref:tRNA pseudouridine synthase C n=1 Tax=Fuerstiella marisgermanici TaxID=1891926 RepID=A0A1P8WHG5_9PLAN|nr:pseudouridine synthase [Fuerstiella marisgermanici]APZ93498.1 tRNA pseudouridine synthase C [Fuerstiella marisgermanici]